MKLPVTKVRIGTSTSCGKSFVNLSVVLMANTSGPDAESFNRGQVLFNPASAVDYLLTRASVETASLQNFHTVGDNLL